ncbi:MAG: hypothetical protein E7015_01965 [Alphaproteobacteria bacterium]|nr:hypothetical protein [Alphaproteobacteria bacterium]
MTISCNELSNILAVDHVVLLLQGCRNFSFCSLSNTVCYMLKSSSIQFSSVSLLNYPEIKEWIQQQHPSMLAPYLYIGGNFIGGFDEISALYRTNRLTVDLCSGHR